MMKYWTECNIVARDKRIKVSYLYGITIQQHNEAQALRVKYEIRKRKGQKGA